MTRRYQGRSRSLALRLAAALVQGFAGVVCAHADTMVVPPEIEGLWRPREPSRAEGILRLSTGGTGIDGPGGASGCRLVGLRELSRSRWYLDFECSGGGLLQLDINRIETDLMIGARRPLGEADLFERFGR